jgi:chromosome segregation ATPase
MSDAGDRRRREELSAAWERAERAAQEAATGLGFWRRRAREAEEEVARLRGALEELAGGRQEPSADVREELRRLRAENTALRSRMLQARKRVAALMKRLATLGMEP